MVSRIMHNKRFFANTFDAGSNLSRIMHNKRFFANTFDAGSNLSYHESNPNMLQEDQNSNYYLVFYNVGLETTEQ